MHRYFAPGRLIQLNWYSYCAIDTPGANRWSSWIYEATDRGRPTYMETDN